MKSIRENLGRLFVGATIVASAVGVGGCRGDISEKPPVHLLHALDDMAYQKKYFPEGVSAFFKDGAAMRKPVEGTVSQLPLKEENPAFYEGIDAATGKPLVQAPIAVDERVLRRGEERFGIYCAPCHGKAGDGHGIVAKHGFMPPPSDLTIDHARAMADGEIFQAISHGIRNMPSYGLQVPEADRWAIVTWVRVLERSQHGTLADVPADLHNQIEAGGAN